MMFLFFLGSEGKKNLIIHDSTTAETTTKNVKVVSLFFAYAEIFRLS